MEPKLQTKVTDANRTDLLKTVYPVLTKPKDHLLQLNQYSVSTLIMADCCGWHYQSHWPDLDIVGLETMYSIRDYQLSRQQFHAMIDSRNYHDIKWPKLTVENSALIFDHAAILKYRTVRDIVNVINNAVLKYQPKIVVYRALTYMIDDARLTDRFCELSTLLIPGYVVTKFDYSVTDLHIEYKKKQTP